MFFKRSSVICQSIFRRTRNTVFYFAPALCVSSGLMLSAAPAPALAENVFYYANITSIRNRVNRLPKDGQPLPANNTNSLILEDGLATGLDSGADLRFNDGSLARFGQQVLFQFQPGTRRITLSNGTLLMVIPPNQGQTRIKTPNAMTQIAGSAFFIRYDAAMNRTIVGALTDSGSIQVSRSDESSPQTLRAGQVVIITGTTAQAPIDFDLKTFYATSPLVAEFQLDRPKVNNPDPVLASVRSETLAALAAQSSFVSVESTSDPKATLPLVNKSVNISEIINLNQVNQTRMPMEQPVLLTSPVVPNIPNVPNVPNSPSIATDPTHPVIVVPPKNLIEPANAITNLSPTMPIETPNPTTLTPSTASEKTTAPSQISNP